MIPQNIGCLSFGFLWDRNHVRDRDLFYSVDLPNAACLTRLVVDGYESESVSFAIDFHGQAFGEHSPAFCLYRVFQSNEIAYLDLSVLGGGGHGLKVLFDMLLCAALFFKSVPKGYGFGKFVR